MAPHHEKNFLFTIVCTKADALIERFTRFLKAASYNFVHIKAFNELSVAAEIAPGSTPQFIAEPVTSSSPCSALWLRTLPTTTPSFTDVDTAYACNEIGALLYSCAKAAEIPVLHTQFSFGEDALSATSFSVRESLKEKCSIHVPSQRLSTRHTNPEKQMWKCDPPRIENLFLAKHIGTRCLWFTFDDDLSLINAKPALVPHIITQCDATVSKSWQGWYRDFLYEVQDSRALFRNAVHEPTIDTTRGCEEMTFSTIMEEAL